MMGIDTGTIEGKQKVIRKVMLGTLRSPKAPLNTTIKLLSKNFGWSEDRLLDFCNSVVAKLLEEYDDNGVHLPERRKPTRFLQFS